jgi:hypothetical protein
MVLDDHMTLLLTITVTCDADVESVERGSAMLCFYRYKVDVSTIHPGVSDILYEVWEQYFDVWTLLGDIVIFWSVDFADDEMGDLDSEIVEALGTHSRGFGVDLILGNF